MKLYLAQLMDTEIMERVCHTDDVNLVLFCARHMNSFNRIAEIFNQEDKRTGGGAPIRIDPKDAWEIVEIGKAADTYKHPQMITYTVADA